MIVPNDFDKFELKEDVILDLSIKRDYLEEQLNCQGYTLGIYVEYYEPIVYNIQRAWVTGLITNTEYRHIFRRIAKDIAKWMKPIEGSE